MMILILVIYLTAAFASSHEKYIDLLPEEEKQEFLDRVLRRILETVQQKVPKTSSSVVLSDENLQEHNDFVQSILKEESEQMRRSKLERVNKNYSDDDNLEVKPLNTVKIEVTDKIEVPKTVPVDFTINDVRRRNSNKTVTENFLNNVTNDANENISTIHKRSVLTDDNTNSNLEEKYTVTSKEQNEVILDNLTQTSKSPVSSISFLEPTTELQDWDTKQYDYPLSTTHKNKTIYNSLKHTTLGDEPKSDLESEITTILNSKLKENHITLETGTYIDIPTTALNTAEREITNYTSDEQKYKLLKNNRIYIQPITEQYIYNKNENINRSERLDDDSVENDNKNTPIQKNKLNLMKSNVTSGLNLTKSKSGDSEDRELGVKDYSSLMGTLSDKGTIDITKTTAYDVFTVQTINPNVFEYRRKNFTKNNTNIGKEEDNRGTTSELISKSTVKEMIKKAKKNISKTKRDHKNIKLLNTNKTLVKANARLKENESKAKQKQKYNSFDYMDNTYQDKILKNEKECKGEHCKQYNVYEVQSPTSSDDDLSFLRSQSVDQKYFIPVYDYSPNKAYYNSENRYGPNLIEENSIELDTEGLRIGATSNINVPNKRDLPEFIINLDDEVDKFTIYHKNLINHGYIKDSNHFKKPSKEYHISKSISHEYDEEFTTEYSIHIPNSHELLHPYNSIKKDLKTHIKDIRDILYYNRFFGDVPRKTKEDYVKYISNKHVKRDERKDDLLISRNNDKNGLKDYFDGRKKKNIDKSLTRIKTLDIIDDINDGLAKFYRAVLLGVLSEENESAIKKIHEIQENKAEKLDTINQGTDEKDILINLQNVKDMNMTRMKKNKYMSIYLKTLKTLIVEDNKALKQYDWLGTTVKIQSALQKLKILIKRLQDMKPIHPSDLEILKYMAFLKNFSSQILEINYYKNELRKKRILPKSKNKNKRIIKDKGLMNRVWLYLRMHLPDLTVEEQVTELESFIMNIGDGLYDLHEALQNIAMITKYKNQNWYTNLKELYLNTEEKTLRELLLHLSLSRLISLIEDSCKNGLEEDFVKYIKTHRMESKRTLEETIFVLRIINEINKELG